jgi:hypothetical protein
VPSRRSGERQSGVGVSIGDSKEYQKSIKRFKAGFVKHTVDKDLAIGQIRPHEKLPLLFLSTAKEILSLTFMRPASAKPALRSCHRVAPRQRLTTVFHVLKPKVLSKKPDHTSKDSSKGLRARRADWRHLDLL